MDDQVELIIHEEPVCSICLEEIQYDDMFAIIDGSPEGNIRYHASCLQEWFNHKDNVLSKGVISRETVNSYTIYQKDELIGTVALRDENQQRIIVTDPTNQNVTVTSKMPSKLSIILITIIIVLIIIITLKLTNIL